MEILSPARIMEVGLGFWPAKVLLSAIELGVFTELGANFHDRARAAGCSSVAPESQPRFLRYLGGAAFS